MINRIYPFTTTPQQNKNTPKSKTQVSFGSMTTQIGKETKTLMPVQELVAMINIVRGFKSNRLSTAWVKPDKDNKIIRLAAQNGQREILLNPQYEIPNPLRLFSGDDRKYDLTGSIFGLDTLKPPTTQIIVRTKGKDDTIREVSILRDYFDGVGPRNGLPPSQAEELQRTFDTFSDEIRKEAGIVTVEPKAAESLPKEVLPAPPAKPAELPKEPVKVEPPKPKTEKPEAIPSQPAKEELEAVSGIVLQKAGPNGMPMSITANYSKEYGLTFITVTGKGEARTRAAIKYDPSNPTMQKLLEEFKAKKASTAQQSPKNPESPTPKSDLPSTKAPEAPAKEVIKPLDMNRLKDLSTIETILKSITKQISEVKLDEKASGPIGGAKNRKVFVSTQEGSTNRIEAFFSTTEEEQPSRLENLVYIYKAGNETKTIKMTRDEVYEPVFRKWEKVLNPQGESQVQRPELALVDEVELVLRLTMKDPSLERFAVDLKESGYIQFEPTGTLKHKFPHIKYEPRIRGTQFTDSKKQEIIKPEGPTYSEKMETATRVITSKLLDLHEQGDKKLQNLDLNTIREMILHPSFNFPS